MEVNMAYDSFNPNIIRDLSSKDNDTYEVPDFELKQNSVSKQHKANKVITQPDSEEIYYEVPDVQSEPKALVTDTKNKHQK